jgi:hypothetical protein
VESAATSAVVSAPTVAVERPAICVAVRLAAFSPGIAEADNAFNCAVVSACVCADDSAPI